MLHQSVGENLQVDTFFVMIFYLNHSVFELNKDIFLIIYLSKLVVYSKHNYGEL